MQITTKKISMYGLLSLLVGVLYVLSMTDVYAAEIIARTPSGVGVGDAFTVSVLLDTEDERINALEGTLQYTRSTLVLRELRTGNSIVNFWVEQPSIDKPGSVRFAGVTPGGFHGNEGEIFTLVFEAVKSGRAEISLQDGKAYRNTDDGIAFPLVARIPAFAISEKGGGMSVQSILETDKTPPESFTPMIATDQSLFEGRSFIVFATQDKGSSVDHYEVAERKGFPFALLRKMVWQKAVSPFVLSDQSRMSYVYVKAVDKAGNERIARLSPSHQFFYFSNTALIAILLVLFGSVLLFYVRKRKIR